MTRLAGLVKQSLDDRMLRKLRISPWRLNGTCLSGVPGIPNVTSFTELTASQLTSMHSTQKPQWVGGCHFNVQPLPLLTGDCDKSLNARVS